MKKRRKNLLGLVLLVFAAVLVGCGSTDNSKELENYQSQIKSLQAKNNELEDENEKLKAESSDSQKLEDEITNLQEENKNLKSELEKSQAQVTELQDKIANNESAETSSASLVDIMFWTDGKEYVITNNDPEMYVYQDSSCLQKLGTPGDFILESKIFKTIEPENGFKAYAFRLQGGTIAFSSKEPRIEEKENK